MEVNWAFVSLGAFGLLAALAWLQRRRTAERVWPAWHAALENRRLEPYEDLEHSLADAHGILVDTLNLARDRAERRDVADAERVMVCAANHVERHVPDLTSRLTMWRTMSHAAQALRPLPRLGVLQFRNWRLRGAATIDRLAHLALDASHRFALRVWVLIRSFGTVRRGFTSAVRTKPREHVSAQVQLTDVSARLRQMEGLNEDLASLHRASLDTYKTLLASLVAPNSRRR